VGHQWGCVQVGAHGGYIPTPRRARVFLTQPPSSSSRRRITTPLHASVSMPFCRVPRRAERLGRAATAASGASTTYRPVPPPVAPPLPPPIVPPGAGAGPVGDWEGPEGGAVVPDRDGVDDDGLGRSAVPSLAHPPAKSISPRLTAASEIGAVLPRMCRHVRVIWSPPRHPDARCASSGPGQPPGRVSHGVYLTTIGADNKSTRREIPAMRYARVFFAKPPSSSSRSRYTTSAHCSVSLARPQRPSTSHGRTRRTCVDGDHHACPSLATPHWGSASTGKSINTRRPRAPAR
jgi:hypothetical protein